MMYDLNKEALKILNICIKEVQTTIMNIMI